MRACVLVVLISTSALAASKPSTAPATPAQLDAIAKRVIAEQAKALDFDDRLFLKDRVTRFTFANADKVKLANDAASEAALVIATGGSSALALSLCAEAVRQAPQEARVVANFGELLHVAKLMKDALPVLAAARALDPKAVAAVTNYANALFELGSEQEAEKAWREALTIDDRYAPAHQGLVALYLKRRDIPRAIEELFKTAEVGFSASMPNALAQVQASQLASSSPAPVPQPAAAAEAQSNRPRQGPGDRLVIPDLPNWPDRMAFVASMPGLQPLVQDIVEGGLGGSIAFAERYYGGAKPPGANKGPKKPSSSDEGAEGEEPAEPEVPVDRGGEASLPKGTPGGPFSKQPFFELELMNMYMADQLQRALDPYVSKGNAASKKMAQGLEQVAASWTPKIQNRLNAGDMAGAKQAMADCSKAGAVVADKFFVEWRDALREGWSRSKEVLELYWVSTDGIVGRIYDKEGFDFAQEVRRTTVKAALLPLAVGMTTQVAGMAIADVACLAPAGAVPPPPPPKAPQKLQIPEKEKEKCPLDGLPGIAAGAFSVEFKCDSVTAEFGEGVLVKFKRTRTGETTIGVGVGLQAKLIGGKAEAKVMVNTTFSRDGHVTSVSIDPKIGLKGTAGALKGSIGAGTSVVIDLQNGVSIAPPKPSWKVGLPGQSSENE